MGFKPTPLRISVWRWRQPNTMKVTNWILAKCKSGFEWTLSTEQALTQKFSAAFHIKRRAMPFFL